ncbi:asparagine synthase-related protein [Owenweeksia hongkongensis]|uniref:asparagine synthase-related protein n=1 Tax=Owenweeksia hongkongensis TaxID=253245 RepID=UPI003A94E8E2
MRHLTHLTVRSNVSSFPKGMRLTSGVFTSPLELGEITVSQRGFDHLTFRADSQNSGRSVLLIGSVVMSGKVNSLAAATDLANSEDLDESVRKLNGEFLVVCLEKSTGRLVIYADRFASYPFYWAAQGEEFVGSYLYTDLAKRCRDWPGFRLRSEKAYEFLTLQRLMGYETHDTLSRILPASGKLVVDPSGSVTITEYREDSYDKRHSVSENELTEEFVGLLEASVKDRLPDEHDYGIFLSGGHDSRLVAAYADERASCYTLGFSNNLEVRCAREVAQALHQRHAYLNMSHDHFVDILDGAAYLSGAMYAVDHSLFVPTGHVDGLEQCIYLHGHALDYMFQGMYLNARPYSFFGRNLFFKRFKPFPNDLSEFFLNNASFRLKFSFMDEFGCEKQRHFLDNHLFESVKSIELKGVKRNYSVDDIWEYLFFHQPSQHYTFTNVLSKRIHGELRTPSFDSRLSDFYKSLPKEYRLYSQMTRAAMRAHPSGIGNILAGNYGLPAEWGPTTKTLSLFGRKFLKELTGRASYATPGAEDRTWPNRSTYILGNERYRERILSALDNNGVQEVMDFLNFDEIKKNIVSIASSNGGASFLVSILTYAMFYNNVYARA